MDTFTVYDRTANRLDRARTNCAKTLAVLDSDRSRYALHAMCMRAIGALCEQITRVCESAPAIADVVAGLASRSPLPGTDPLSSQDIESLERVRREMRALSSKIAERREYMHSVDGGNNGSR